MITSIVNKVLGKAGLRITRAANGNPEKQKHEILARGKSIIQTIAPDLTVLNGPFQGMQYPALEITEATLVPKLVGSYEAQLFPVIEQALHTPYANILDVGSAEGYYAVGFARLMPATTVHCFDVNEKDMDFCRRMAQHNKATNMTYNSWCAPETLINFNYGDKSLIFCDCEGYELDLFTPEVISRLGKADVLVEMHDCVNPVISATLLERFQNTHSFHVINNLNVDHSKLKGLDRLSKEDREFAVFEHRGGYNQNIFMEWAFFSPR